jgi:hypothetical protein
MKTFLMIFFASLVLGAAFTGSSYFVTSEEDVTFPCYMAPNDLHQQDYNTYKETKNGFPFAFYVKDLAPKSGGCDSVNDGLSGGSEVKVKAISSLNKTEFAKDFAIWSGVFLALGSFVFGVGTRKKI